MPKPKRPPTSSPAPKGTPQPILISEDAGIGAEPGINPHGRLASLNNGHFREECVIEVADFSSHDVSFRRFGNEDFIKFIRDPLPVDVGPVQRQGSSGTAHMPIRWINVGGIDWDVVRALALKYNLHALALEDVLHEQGHNHSKADYYDAHLFIRILCHTLDSDAADGDTDVDTEPPSEFPGAQGVESVLERGQAHKAGSATSSPKLTEDFSKETKATLIRGPARKVKRRLTGLTGFHEPDRQRQVMKIRALTRGDRVDVRHEPMCIFLLRNGTVISIRPTASLEFTAPIVERLHQSESVLRTSEDASLLVESLLDLVVDRILEVADKYQDKIHQLEHDVLLRPSMSTVRSLHILSGDLIMHRRTLEPVKAMIYGLRVYDLDRSLALADNTAGSAGAGAGGAWPRVGRRKSGVKDRDPSGDSEEKERVEGYLSYKTTVYLADVNDHIDYCLTSVEMFADISENLINYGFNMAAYETNEVMRRLTLATIIFLPLTLLTGYFGMNFQPFSAVDNHSDLLFWKIALPVMGGLIPMFMWMDIQKAFRYFERRVETRASVKGFRNRRGA